MGGPLSLSSLFFFPGHGKFVLFTSLFLVIHLPLWANLPQAPSAPLLTPSLAKDTQALETLAATHHHSSLASPLATACPHDLHHQPPRRHDSVAAAAAAAVITVQPHHTAVITSSSFDFGYSTCIAVANGINMMEDEGADAIPKHKFSFDVFLSFREVDARHTFTRYLYDSLCRKGFKTFLDDDELWREESDISLALRKAIENARISIVFFI